MRDTWKSFRQASRTDWGREDSKIGREELVFGCLLRIADATEKMAARYSELIADRDRFERWYRNERRRTEMLEHRIRGLRGAITRLKKGKD